MKYVGWRARDIEPDDYVIQPYGSLGSRYQVGTGELGVMLLETYHDDLDSALRAIREDMECRQFWPNVWYVSDHGNYWMIDLETGDEIR